MRQLVRKSYCSYEVASQKNILQLCVASSFFFLMAPLSQVRLGKCQLESCEWVLWIEIGKLLTWLEVVDLEFKTWVDIAISITNTSALLTGFCQGNLTIILGIILVTEELSCCETQGRYGFPISDHLGSFPFCDTRIFRGRNCIHPEIKQR